MRLERSLILFSLSLATACSLFCQNAAAESDSEQPRPIDKDIEEQRVSDFQLGLVYSNYPAQDVEWLKSHGWHDEQIKNAILMITVNESSNEWHQLTNLYHTGHFDIYHIGSSNVFVPATPGNYFGAVVWVTNVSEKATAASSTSQQHAALASTNQQQSLNPNIPTEDIAYLKSQGWSDWEIANATKSVPSGNQQRTTLAPTPPDLKGAIIYLDSFLGMVNQAVPGDVISMRSQALKFRLMGKDYDYSGNYTVILNTPRQHRNPYFGFGSPEMANILVLEDVGGQTFPLQNATIWEKEANFIDAVAIGKEWIYSGTYSIQNQ